MIVYNASKEKFNDDVNMNRISDIILENLREKHISGGQASEYNSWQNSLHFMRSALDDPQIPGDAEVAIEYQIPRTSKRVDFMIAGADSNDNNNVVVIELKQWSRAEKIDDIMSHSVKAYTGNAYRSVNHPSYQAYAYASFIRNFSEQVQDERIGILPCAYLHNLSSKARIPLDDEIYREWLEEAPLFDKSQTLDLRDFIKKFIAKRSLSGDLLYKIDNGRIRPSKALQDCIEGLMKGNEEFILLDDQALAFDICKRQMKECLKDNVKRTVIIQGGPGTGKSVLAVNLLKDFITKELNACYCTKNAAPRHAILKLLAKSKLKEHVTVKQLFRSPFGLNSLSSNFYDCLLIDESHRLMKKMYGDWNGENQIKECINSSLLTVFFIDENQKITTKDIGSIEEIKKWADEFDSEIIMSEDTVLHSQFRCNGSDQYIQLIDNILQTNEYVDVDTRELKYDIKVFDDPNELRDLLREINKKSNKARMVAGYCYDWKSKADKKAADIQLKNGFEAQWNFKDDNIWAINPKSFEQVGCIHTAQGLEFDYVGVIIGKDLRYDIETGKVITDKTQLSKDDKSSGIRSSNDDIADMLIRNTYKILLTRGQKGCYIYCEDEPLSEHIKKIVER